MAAFMIGTPILAAKVAAAKPAVARRNTTVKAAASSESINRRAAVAGVLAVFAAPAANAFSLPSLPSFGGDADAEPKEEKPKVAPAPRGETKKVRKTEKKSTKKDPYKSPSSGGLGNNKAPRAYLRDQQAEIAKYYGLDLLPGQAPGYTGVGQ